MNKFVVLLVSMVMLYVSRGDLLPNYYVVDLDGDGEGRYSVSTCDSIPDGGWTDDYKTNKIVLRRVDPGRVMTGCKKNGNEREVVISNAYYLGVFEVTQAQYEKIQGANPSYWENPLWPACNVSWQKIRAFGRTNINGRAAADWIFDWPRKTSVAADSFMGKLRDRTGNNGFDLPTEAQWLHACQYGMSPGAWGVDAKGNEVFDASLCGQLVGRRTNVYSSPMATVGSLLPNKLGLYDMHGNVCEWCLDNISYVPDHLKEQSMIFPDWYYGIRVLQGCSWQDSVAKCYYNCQDYHAESYGGRDFGFRIALNVMGSNESDKIGAKTRKE